MMHTYFRFYIVGHEREMSISVPELKVDFSEHGVAAIWIAGAKRFASDLQMA
jgi:hypothetical protein